MDRKSMQDTALSAEVEPFVPGCSGKPMMAYHGQDYYKQYAGVPPPPPNHMSQPPLTELPRYMTSCFPFVAESSSSNGSSNDARWQGHASQGHASQGHAPQGHAPQSYHQSYQQINNSNFYQQQQQPPQVFANTHPQQYPPQPHNFPGQYQEQNYSRRDGRDLSQYNGPPASYNAFVNHGPSSNASVPVTNYHTGYNNVGFGSKAGHYPMNNYHYNNQNTYQPPVQRQPQRQKNWHGNLHGNMKTNPVDWRKNMQVNRPTSEPKRPAKTLMMVDASHQTDFCPDIADKTLAELPSHLQNMHLSTRRKSQGQQTGNDMSTTQATSADMDNDSGYYSPKHMHVSTSTSMGLQQGGVEKPAVFTPPQEGMFYHGYQHHNQQQHLQTNMACIMPTPSQAFHNNPNHYNMPAPHGMNYANALTHKVAHNPAAHNPAAHNQQGHGQRLPNHSIPHLNHARPATHNHHRTQNNYKPKAEYGLAKGKASSYSSQPSSESEHVGYNHTVKPPQLHDTSEYPGLPGGKRDTAESQVAKHSYSAVVKKTFNHQSFDTMENESQNENELIQPGEIIQPETLMSPDVVASGIKDGKNARKRRKKAIQAAKAAAREYSEITQEQKQLQENLKKPNKRTKMPIEFDLGDMLAVLEKQQQDVRNNQEALAATKSAGVARTKPSEEFKALNPLDTTLIKKRGKERENPVKKKPSALKKVILKEREEKKRQRALDENCLSDDGLANESNGDIENITTVDTSLGLSQEAVSERGSIISGLTCSQSDLSPVSQMSPMDLSPLSPGSPLSSGLSSPATSMSINSPSHVASKIHSRRFREYCNQVLDKDIDACCTTLLQALIKFQDRQYHKDPTKAKSKRRIVMGLREVTKHLKLKKIKCIIVSPNLEKIQAKGGLDDALENISTLAQEQSVPLVFALGRKALGRAVNKLVPVSVVGLFNYDGAEETFQQLLQLSSKARTEYDDMIKKYQQDLEAANVARSTKRRHYMGHNRNLSGCSAISFSSVISEPISEDYPHPEPATDSRGNVLSNQDSYMYSSKSHTWDMRPPIAIDSTPSNDEPKTATSKASSETLEPTAGEKDDVTEVDDDEDDEDEDDRNALYELEEIENHDENGVESEEETQRTQVEVPEDSTSDTRVANWVVEAQSCFKNLSLKTSDDEGAITSAIPQEIVNT